MSDRCDPCRHGTACNVPGEHAVHVGVQHTDRGPVEHTWVRAAVCVKDSTRLTLA